MTFHRHTTVYTLGGLILLGWLLAACQAAKPASLPPEEIVANAARRMSGLAGFHFLIERSGHPAYLDEAETIAFRRAEGDYVAPDRARAKVRVIAPGLIAEVDMVSIGQDYFETNLLTGQWQQFPTDQGFNPAVLFDPETGFQVVLENDLSELTLAGIEELEEVPGKQLYKLQGTVGGEKLYEMSYSMIGPQPMQVSLWIAPDTFDLYRALVIDSASDPADPTQWKFDFWDFDKPAEIGPPPVE